MSMQRRRERYVVTLVCWEMVVNVMLYTLSSLIAEIILEPVLYIIQHKQPRLDYLTIEQFFSERTNALGNETRTKGTFSAPQVLAKLRRDLISVLFEGEK